MSDKFESALAQVNLIHALSLSVFLVGLGYHIQMHVCTFNPTSIAHNANIAKLQ